jgi:hypothetical protein
MLENTGEVYAGFDNIGAWQIMAHFVKGKSSG